MNAKTYSVSDVQIDWSEIQAQAGTAISWSAGTSDRITINTAGWYLVEASMYANLIGAIRTNQQHGIRFQLFNSAGGNLSNQNSGDQKIITKSAASFDTYWNIAMKRKFDVGDYIKLGAVFFTTDIIRAQISVSRLGS